MQLDDFLHFIHLYKKRHRDRNFTVTVPLAFMTSILWNTS